MFFFVKQQYVVLKKKKWLYFFIISLSLGGASTVHVPDNELLL